MNFLFNPISWVHFLFVLFVLLACISITPFVAINFATFDTVKTTAHHLFPASKDSIPVTLGLGAFSGLFAQTCCYVSVL